MAQSVTVERQGPVSVITMDDGKANALSFDILTGVTEALAAADEDPEIAAAVVAGRPGRFCAGFDLEVVRGGSKQDRVNLVAGGGDLVRLAYRSGIPVVAACTGHAVAAGALFLLGCDHRIGPQEPGTKIGLNEVAIGLSLPDWALTIAGERLAKRHLQMSVANSRIYDGPGAVDAGFLDEVVPGDEVVNRSIARATELAESLDPRSYAHTIGAIRGQVVATMADQLAEDRRRLS